MTVDLRQGDNRATLRRMIADGEFVDSVVTDPPYGLVSVAKRFGGANVAPAKFGTDGAFSRQSRGFMGKLWDGTGIERDPEFWHLVYQVMKPGAYIIAFSSSRTYGYMQVAMETAGFITHPMFGWVFNTGFPKGHDAGRAIDKTLGTEHLRPNLGKSNRHGGGVVGAGTSYEMPPEIHDLTGPGSSEAAQWDGWKTGTQSMKPALEPVYFGQKPFSEKTGALNILKHGVGAVNIDACRVNPGEFVPGGGKSKRGASAGGGSVYGDGSSDENAQAHDLGRYPANLMHDGSPEVVALFPQSGGQIAHASTSSSPRPSGRVYGDLKRGNGREGEATAGKRYTDDGSTNFAMTPGARREDGGGSAARFFNSFPHEGPVLCYPKAGKADRAGSKHATVKPIALMQHFVRLVTPPGGICLDPFAGTGTTGQAALNEGMRCILMEAEREYARDIRKRFLMPETFGDRLFNLTEAL